MTLGALGVVFGDLGTSPLYAFKAAFAEPLFKDHGVGMTNSHQVDHLMGVLSLFLWSIVIVICLKYVIFMMRADNDGKAACWRCSACCNESGSGLHVPSVEFLLVVSWSFWPSLVQRCCTETVSLLLRSPFWLQLKESTSPWGGQHRHGLHHWWRWAF